MAVSIPSGQRQIVETAAPAAAADWPAARQHAMDVRRPRRRRWPARVAVAAAGLAALAAATVALSRVRPAAPRVERSTVWMDTVRRGAMARQVRGSGTLAPEEIRWVTATTAGRVERIALLPGVAVEADTVLVELSNPELEQAVVDLESQVVAAEAQLRRLALQLESDRLAQESVLATLRSELTVARVEAEGDDELRQKGHGSELVARRSRARAEELAGRVPIEARRLNALGRSGRAQLLVQQAEIAKLRAQAALRRRQLAALEVRAGIAGVLQRIGDEQPLRVGQHVAAGAPLARIANQTRLKAEIKIAETQAKDVQLGQPAAIDTRNGVVAGRVARIDPAVQSGTVTVDVALEGPLPPGARPDLSVDGTITLERLPDVLYVGRPVGVPAEGRAGLFKVTDGGRAAIRVPVRLGRGSADSVEIADGLALGDQVILSDMSPWDAHDRLQLE
jgi:HlyD family secretion protein